MSWLRPPSPYETAPTSAAPAPSGARLDIGRVFGRAFAIIRQRWVVLSLFVAAFFAIDLAFARFIRIGDQPGRYDLRTALGIAASLALMCLGWLRDTAVIAVAVQRDRRRLLLSLGGALRQALGAFPTVLPFFVLSDSPSLAQWLWREWSGVDLLLAPVRLAELNVMIALVELAFAAVITACWGVFVPVAIVEEGGARVSWSRAWRLLSGSRWRLIAIYVVLTVMTALAVRVAFPITETLHLAGRGYFAIELEVADWLSSMVAATWQVMIASTYLELRRVREGVVVGDLAEVFA